MRNNTASIVTGGGKGIGRAVALKLAASTNVVLVGRDQKALQDTCLEVDSLGAQSTYLCADVKNPQTALDAVALVRSRGWQLKNLVCNAGIGTGGNTDSFSQSTWIEMFEVNVHGCFWFVQAALPEMLTNKNGKICIISSVAGIKGFKRQAAYSATKHALVGLAKSLALEYGKRGIVTVPICPAFVMTDMTERVVSGLVKHQGLTRDQAIAKISATNPLNRIITPDEVADSVELVCSGKLDHMNGNPLVLNGGE